MLKVKWNYEKIQRSCRLIQRTFRGFIKGRRIFFESIQHRSEDMQMAFFHEMAKII
jgi:hypothetical protein